MTALLDSVYDASEYTLKFEEGESEACRGYQDQGIPETLGYLDLETLSGENKKKLKQQDGYGFKKLRAESYLLKTASAEGFSVLSLRLADVIGPYDETFRFWKQVIWA